MMVAFALLTISSAVQAGSWQTYDVPDAYATYLTGVSGGNYVGSYYSDSGYHGFLYDGTNLTTLDMPGANGDTQVVDINGNNIIGVYRDGGGAWQSFLYNGSGYTQLAVPGAISTSATAISSNAVVGSYRDDAGEHKFKYDFSSFTELNLPVDNTSLLGIEGNTIVGNYFDGNTMLTHGFIYDGSSLIDLDVQGASISSASGISGGRIAGCYYDSNYYEHGFIYEDSQFTLLDMPGASSTQFNDIDGNTSVGSYNNGGFDHGFIYTTTVPEPGSLLSLVAGMVGAAGFALRRRKA